MPCVKNLISYICPFNDCLQHVFLVTWTFLDKKNSFRLSMFVGISTWYPSANRKFGVIRNSVEVFHPPPIEPRDIAYQILFFPNSLPLQFHV